MQSDHAFVSVCVCVSVCAQTLRLGLNPSLKIMHTPSLGAFDNGQQHGQMFNAMQSKQKRRAQRSMVCRHTQC